MAVMLMLRLIEDLIEDTMKVLYPKSQKVICHHPALVEFGFLVNRLANNLLLEIVENLNIKFHLGHG